jgi:hypothetical protein
MDFHASIAEDGLVPGLVFAAPPTASYIRSRESVTFSCAGSQTYVGGQGSRLIKIVVSGEGWLDPSHSEITIYT